MALKILVLKFTQPSWIGCSRWLEVEFFFVGFIGRKEKTSRNCLAVRNGATVCKIGGRGEVGQQDQVEPFVKWIRTDLDYATST